LIAHHPPKTAVARRQGDNPEMTALIGITRKVISTEHFVSVKIAGKSAHIEALALDGSVLDRVDLN
jgi:hypothetical protein